MASNYWIAKKNLHGNPKNRQFFMLQNCPNLKVDDKLRTYNLNTLLKKVCPERYPLWDSLIDSIESSDWYVRKLDINFDLIPFLTIVILAAMLTYKLPWYGGLVQMISRKIDIEEAKPCIIWKTKRASFWEYCCFC